jgi:hypothetical protein
MLRSTSFGRFCRALGIRVLGLVVALTVAASGAVGQQAPGAVAASDQTAPALGNFWFRVGLGGAGARLTCDLCETGRDVGPAVDLAIGSSARPDLRVGVEAGGWTHNDDGSRENTIDSASPPTSGRTSIEGPT